MINGLLSKDIHGRWTIVDQTSGEELFTIKSGTRIEILGYKEWRSTVIEHFNGDYGSVDNITLTEGIPVRFNND